MANGGTVSEGLGAGMVRCASVSMALADVARRTSDQQSRWRACLQAAQASRIKYPINAAGILSKFNTKKFLQEKRLPMMLPI
jgi:hypothetical protein